MCILFIAIKQHPSYPLIVCANRDEFYERPTRPMHLWQGEEILAGKDMLSGGTWFGVNRTGAFSALTNLRIPNLFDENNKSRGELVVKALTENDGSEDSTSLESYLKESAHQYNPFNLLYEKHNNIYCFDSVSKQSALLSNGFHSICNGAIDDIWPKMAKGTQLLAQCLLDSARVSERDFLTLLGDRTKPSIELLPDTGIAPELEAELSSIFVQMPSYGTRSSTILLRGNDGNSTIFEYQFTPQGMLHTTQKFTLENGQLQRHS